MKKHLALVLALVMVLSSFSFVSAAPDFSDMEGHENAEAVARLELLNVLKGYPDGTFKPDNTITRAEFAAVAVRVSGLENVAMAAQGLPSGFTDVPAWHWASGYVGTASKMGIVNGIGNGLFAPETPVKYEEAITMIVRALGYEPMAQARGGYPFGYLIVANEIDLLEDAMGVQGTWATRAFVAQITDNALEIPMMIQVGFGSDAKWVVSGSEEHGEDADEKYLLDQMGFEAVEGRVVDYDTDDMEIEIEDEDVYEVAEGFDFYEVHGVTVKVWLDGDMVIAHTLEDDVMFDAVEFEEDDTELTLVTADKDYDLAEDRDDVPVTEFILDNSDAYKYDDDDFFADYAKVVFDGNDVIWAEGFTFDDFIVVEEVDDEDLVDLNDEDVDVEDYLIVKDGKTISIEDIMKGDIVFLFDNDYRDYDGFAVVANMTEEGVVTTAYTDSFKLDGTTYDLAAGAMYLDGDNLEMIDDEALEGFEDEGEEITIYLDFYGDVVLMMGETGDPETSTYGAILTDEANIFQDNRSEEYFIAWDLVNEMGEEVSFDEETTTTSGAIAAKWDVVEYEVDEDGDLEEVVLLKDEMDVEWEVVTGVAIEVDDRYEEEGYRLEDDAVVFLVEDPDDDEVDEVFLWGDAEDFFGEMTDYIVYAKDGEVIYLVVIGSDAGGDFDTETGVVVDTRTRANGDVELTIFIDGDEYEFDFDADEVVGIEEGDVVTFEINEEMDEIEEGSLVELGPDADDYIDVESERNGTFAVGSDDFELARNAYVFDADLDLVDLDDIDGEYVEIYFDNGSTYFVEFVIVVTAP